jgi:hypothetical protein
MMGSTQLERRLRAGLASVTSRGISRGELWRTLVATSGKTAQAWSRRTAQAWVLSGGAGVAVRTMPSVMELCADDEREPITFMSLDVAKGQA